MKQTQRLSWIGEFFLFFIINISRSLAKKDRVFRVGISSFSVVRPSHIGPVFPQNHGLSRFCFTLGLRFSAHFAKIAVQHLPGQPQCCQPCCNCSFSFSKRAVADCTALLYQRAKRDNQEIQQSTCTQPSPIFCTPLFACPIAL